MSLPKSYLPAIKPRKSLDGMPRYLPGQLVREQLFAFDRDRRSYIIAMDPEGAQVYHKYFKKYATDRVSISHIDAFCTYLLPKSHVLLRDGS